jgi:3-hydroxy acid dehydrogenase/malonic semialdehyde reductase
MSLTNYPVRLQEFSVVRFGGDKAKADAVYKGVEPLTPDDIAEVVVFTAGRRENVVVADTLIFPNHQVCLSLSASSSAEDFAAKIHCANYGSSF